MVESHKDVEREDNLTGDQAFGMLSRLSQQDNVKLREVARRLAAARGNWAPASRPVRLPGGVCTGGSVT